MAEDLEWLVKQRSKTQEYLLELYRFGELHKERLEKNDSLSSSFQLLVGTAFSLWRAVFLIREHSRGQESSVRDISESLRKGMEFLELVIADNAINYPQDKKTSEWSAGYYLNNAFFRLRRVSKNLDSENPKEQLGPEQITGLEDCATFERALNSAASALQELESTLEK